MRTIAEIRDFVREARAKGCRVGFVPTMGAFHAGHESLMQAAGRECDVVVVSLFVNPAQFTGAADFDGYPRDEQRDAAIAAGQGVLRNGRRQLSEPGSQ
ncbi:pantoate--beta-alanine ligase [Saccharopolyspora hattusasensis]|uniref:pantoate--beta-alanine ligase n=1 Tax=Saccharopolyspora hattusasensis TaxID=1128679 RepID=UPI003D972159